MSFISAQNRFLSFQPTNLQLFLIWWTMHLWISVCGNTDSIACSKPLRPSIDSIRMSFTPLFFILTSADIQNFADSASPIQNDICCFLYNLPLLIHINRQYLVCYAADHISRNVYAVYLAHMRINVSCGHSFGVH